MKKRRLSIFAKTPALALTPFLSLGLSLSSFGIADAQQVPVNITQSANATQAVAKSTDVAHAASSRLESYVNKEGQGYFALSLMPKEAVLSAEAHDIVVLFDTSASQSGSYRQKALDALQGILADASDKDRVQLFALDIRAVPMSNALLNARSLEMNQAVQKLHSRTPLGSTDMGEGLKTALESVAKSTNPKRVIYIGDGENKGGANGDELRTLIDQLVKNHVSVSSYAIGPERNNAFLAAVSNMTGGSIVLDGDEITAQQAGKMSLNIARQPVMWPTSVKLPAELAKIYPTTFPPLRADRDTVVVGVGKLDKAVDVQITANIEGRTSEMKWTVEPTASKDDSAYLAQLIDLAKTDSGYGLPILGTVGLNETAFQLNRGADQLASLGRNAIKAGQIDQAKKLSDEALRRDPNNNQALMVRDALSRANVKVAAHQAPVAAEQGSPEAVNPAGPKPLTMKGNGVAPQQNNDLPPPPASFVETVDQRIELIEQKIRSEVAAGMTAARHLLPKDPHRAETDLKILLDRVNSVQELRPLARGELESQLSKQIRDAVARGIEWDNQLVQNLRNQTAAQEAQDAINVMNNNQSTVKQLIERYNALMDEGRFKEAELKAALHAYNLEKSPTTASAYRNSYTYASYHESIDTFLQHNKSTTDSLLQTDKASIPFPDVPPIVYPDADFWRKITKERAKYKNVDLSKAGSAEQRISDELQKPTTFGFVGASLEDIAEDIKARHKIEVQIDKAALEAATFDTATRFDKSVTNIKLRAALRLLLADHGLSYIIKNEVLLITSEAKQKEDMVTKVYPVADLVIPIPVNGGGGTNPFSLGGGNGGGGPGQFGGGGQQGGFGGGQQGQFGGGGGGFGGGGAFNVLDPIELPAKNEGLQAWAVPDKLELKKNSAGSSTSQPAAAKATEAAAITPAAKNGIVMVDSIDSITDAMKSKPTRIVVEVKAGEDFGAAWDRYFRNVPEVQGASGAERLVKVFNHDANVRFTSNQLIKESKYKEESAMLQSALRNGFNQPWMYEALGLAMLADNQPVSEIERALMSSVDHASSTNDLLLTAMYMTKFDSLKPRALKLLRRVSEIEPTRHESYVMAMIIAEQTNNLEAKEWSTLGVLSKAWTKDKADVALQAQRLAAATIAELKKQGKTEAVAKFEKGLKNALSRDLIVRVSYVGDADIDLKIEEAPGTVCSLANPRTTSGGVLLGDLSEKRSLNANATHVEEYVVPEGFAGRYRVNIKRIFGQVATGKVNVEIISNYGTDKQQSVKRPLSLTDKEIMVVYDLKDGRRVESLKDAQVANAAREVNNVNQAILAQQLATLGSGAGTTPSTVSGTVPNPFGNAGGFFPFGRSGAVGYMPVIVTLPEGPNLSATGVVSADRRYVRITSTPLFTAVPEVSTFNLNGGGGTTQALNGGGGSGIGTGGVGGQGGGGIF